MYLDYSNLCLIILFNPLDIPKPPKLTYYGYPTNYGPYQLQDNAICDMLEMSMTGLSIPHIPHISPHITSVVHIHEHNTFTQP